MKSGNRGSRKRYNQLSAIQRDIADSASDPVLHSLQRSAGFRSPRHRQSVVQPRRFPGSPDIRCCPPLWTGNPWATHSKYSRLMAGDNVGGVSMPECRCQLTKMHTCFCPLRSSCYKVCLVSGVESRGERVGDHWSRNVRCQMRSAPSSNLPLALASFLAIVVVANVVPLSMPSRPSVITQATHGYALRSGLRVLAGSCRV